MKTPARKILRDIWSRKGRTLLVSASIFIGVFGVVALTTVGQLIVKQLNADLDPDELPMLWIGVNVASNVTLDNATYLATLEQTEGVTSVQAQASYPIYWREAPDEAFIEANMRAYSKDFSDLEIIPLEVVEGTFPEAGQNEIAIERRMADRLDLKVGDTMEFRILSDKSGTLVTENWTISGIVFHPYVEGNSAVYAHYADAQHLAGFNGYSQIFVRYTDFATAEENQQAFLKNLTATSPYIITFSFAEDPAKNAFVEEISQWTDTLTGLAVLAMIVSTFIVFNVVNSIMVEQRRQIGVMKSLGATRPDSFRIYTGVALAYGVLGTIPGVLLGIPAGYALTQVLAPLLNILMESFDIAPIAVISGTLMGLLVPVFASLLPVFFGTRVTIREAMTDLGIGGKFKHGIWSQILHLMPMPATMRQAFGNIIQKKARLAITGFSLTLAIGAFMGVFALFYSLDTVVAGAFATYNYEIEVQPTELRDYASVKALIDEIDGVEAVFPSADSGVKISNKPLDESDKKVRSIDVGVTGFDPSTDTILLDLKEGRGWQDDPTRRGVILTSGQSEDLGLGVGDTVYLTAQNGKTEAFEVIGIDSFPFDDDIFMRWDDLAYLVGFTINDTKAGATTVEPMPQELAVRLQGDWEPVDVDKKIGEIREALLNQGITASYFNVNARAEEQSNLVRTAGLIFGIACLVMALVGAIGLLVTLSMSVFERQREIGVMRSVGASSGAVVVQFLIEGVLIGMIAFVLGVPLSYLVAKGMLMVLPIEFAFSYPLISLVIGFVGMLVIATLASIGPAILAARKTVSSILRYQ